MDHATDQPDEVRDLVLEHLSNEFDIPEKELARRLADPDITLAAAGLDDPVTLANFLFVLRKLYEVEVPRPSNGDYSSHKFSYVLSLCRGAALA